jgi:hypothetical protein
MSVAMRANGKLTFGTSNPRTVPVDASAQAGDWLIVAVFANLAAGTYSFPGMTLISDVSNSTVARMMLYKVKLAAGDLGGGFVITGSGLTAGTQLGIMWFVASGGDVNDIAPQFSNAFQGSPSTSRVLPGLTVANDQSEQLVFIFDKANTGQVTTTYTAPAGHTILQQTAATGAGGVAGMMATKNALLAGGASSAATYTADFAPTNVAIAQVLLSPNTPVQYFRPVSDVTKTGVTAVPAVSVFAQNIDEVTLDQTDYVQFNTVGDTYIGNFSAGADPLTSGGHAFEWSTDLPAGAVSATLTLELLSSTNAVLAGPFTRTFTVSNNNFVENLSTVEADAIGNYSTMRYRLVLTAAS